MHRRFNDALIRPAAALVLLVSLLASPAFASNMSPEVIARAAQQAVQARREARFVRVYGHEFHVKPPIVQPWTGNLTRVRVQIPHHRSLASDSQFYFTALIDRDARVRSFSIRVGGDQLSQGEVAAYRGLDLRTLNEVFQRELASDGRTVYAFRGARHLALGVLRSVAGL